MRLATKPLLGRSSHSVYTYKLFIQQRLCISDSVQLVQNDLVRTQALFDASTYLSDLLARYSIIEQRYPYQNAEDWERLQGCTVSVYSVILKYTLRVKQAHLSGRSGMISA